MVVVMQVLAIVLEAVSLALSLAHALELPGKLRLGKEAYFTTQTIYYPGFTFGGAAEPAAILAMLVLLAVTPFGSSASWLTLAAFLASASAHGIYWALIHPINKVWLADQNLEGAGQAFFAVGGGAVRSDDWTRLRDRWEYSHVARAALALVSLTALAIAAAA
jgi:hypothetical protein